MTVSVSQVMTKQEMATDLGSVSYRTTAKQESPMFMTRPEWVDHYMTFSYDDLLAEMQSYGLLS